MARRLIVLFLFLAVAPSAASQENEFARRSTTEFATTAPSREKGPAGILAAAGRLTVLTQLDDIVSRGPNYESHAVFFGEADLRGYVSITDLFTINGLFRIEQGRDQQSGGAFVDQNLYTQRLFLVVNAGPLHFYGGKIHPRFGTAWYATPGIYGSDFAEDYELQEKLGFGLRADIRRWGRHRLTIEAFQADTSPLGRSPFGPQPGDHGFKRQAKRSLTDGGLSNTGSFESIAVALSSRRIPGLQGVLTDVGWAMQKAPTPDLRDEYSWVAGVGWQGKLADDIRLAPLIEFASVHGQGGANRDTDYLTLAANLRLHDVWAVAAHTTQRFVRDYAAGDFRTDLLAGLSVAYELGEAFKERVKWLKGFSLLAGYRHDRRSGVDRDTVGLQIRFERDL